MCASPAVPIVCVGVQRAWAARGRMGRFAISCLCSLIGDVWLPRALSPVEAGEQPPLMRIWKPQHHPPTPAQDADFEAPPPRSSGQILWPPGFPSRVLMALMVELLTLGDRGSLRPGGVRVRWGPEPQNYCPGLQGRECRAGLGAVQTPAAGPSGCSSGLLKMPARVSSRLLLAGLLHISGARPGHRLQSIPSRGQGCVRGVWPAGPRRNPRLVSALPR